MYQHDQLFHYGVKGMKWGVHRLRATMAAGHRERARRGDERVKQLDRYVSKVRGDGSSRVRRGAAKVYKALQAPDRVAYKLGSNFDRKMAKLYTQKMDPKKKEQYKKTAKRVTERVIAGSATAVTISMIKPSADVVGKALAKRLKEKTGL